jgi:hypothetical protein
VRPSAFSFVDSRKETIMRRTSSRDGVSRSFQPWAVATNSEQRLSTIYRGHSFSGTGQGDVHFEAVNFAQT